MIHKTESINILDKTIDIKVNNTIISNLAIISFFLFMGYMNNTVIVLLLYSSIINLASSTEANTMKVPFTIESTMEKVKLKLLKFISFSYFDAKTIINRIAVITRFAIKAPLIYPRILIFFISNFINLSTDATPVQ